MDSFVTWRELLVVLILVLAFYVAELLLFMRAKTGRAGRASADRETLRELAELREELRQLRQEIQPLGAPAPASAPAKEEAPAASRVESPYARAIELAKQGAGVPEVAAQCGISRGEAELIVAMHRTDMD